MLWLIDPALQIDGLVQERRNSSALAMELRFSCNNPSKYAAMFQKHVGIVSDIDLSWLTTVYLRWVGFIVVLTPVPPFTNMV